MKLLSAPEFKVIDHSCVSQFISVSDLQSFQHFNYEKILKETHTAMLKHGNELAGLAHLYEASEYDSIFMSFLEVSKRGHKFGTLMLRSLFDYASERAEVIQRDIDIVVDGFTTSGKIVLLPELEKLDKQYKNVNLGFIPGA